MTVSYDDFKKHKLNQYFFYFVQLLPKGVFWNIDDKPLFKALIKGILSGFVNCSWYLKTVVDGYFLKNNHSVEKWAKVLDITDDALKTPEEIKKIIRGGAGFTLDKLKKMVQEVDPSGTVTVYGVQMTCIDPCTYPLYKKGMQFVFSVNLSNSISDEDVNSLITKIKRHKPAYLQIVVNGSDVDD